MIKENTSSSYTMTSRLKIVTKKSIYIDADANIKLWIIYIKRYFLKQIRLYKRLYIKISLLLAKL